MRWFACIGALCFVAGASLAWSQEAERAPLSEKQLKLMREFSPLPKPPLDPTNAWGDDPEAARLGQAFFYETRFSKNGEVSCATCHEPERSWTDGRVLGKGLSHVARNTMSLWNVGYNRWFFWDGRKDSLWSQALGPLEDHREHGTSRLAIAHVIANDEQYRPAYERLFGALPALEESARFPAEGRPMPGEESHPHARMWATMGPDDQVAINRLFSNVGKSLAAYERLLVSDRSPFDVFVEGLADGDESKLAALSPAAQRGFGVFSGKGNCHLCHDGPNFTDLEFHSNLVPSEENVDPGRSQGIFQLKQDPFNSRSPFADDWGEVGANKLTKLVIDVHLPGDFKTPSLRNVARTAPYMREGQIATLAEVIEFYSSLKGAADPGLKAERIIQPLNLTPAEKADLLAFLESLTDESLPKTLIGPPK